MTELRQFNLRISEVPESCSSSDVDSLHSLYISHYGNILEAIRKLSFEDIEAAWTSFWKPGEDKPLNNNQLQALCRDNDLQKSMLEVDHRFYENVLDVLLPNILKPLPEPIICRITAFCKKLEPGLKHAMNEFAEQIVLGKTNAVSAFSGILQRYFTLNRVVQSVTSVIENIRHVEQMCGDYDKINFRIVEEQLAFVSQTESIFLRAWEDDFTATIRSRSVEELAKWLRAILRKCQQDEGKLSASQIILQWAHCNTVIFTQLTMNTAKSFGAFHIIRLFLDEYMFYLCERRVASDAATTVISEMVDRMTKMRNHLTIE